MEQGQMGGGRRHLRRDAAQLQHDLRTLLAEMESACPRGRPEPKTLVKDVVRGRAASDETLLAAIIAVARQAPADAVLRFAQGFFGLLMQASERRLPTCLWTVCIAETHAQGVADADQMRALRAIESGDRVSVDRAIESNMAHMWHLMDIVSMLQAARESMHAGRVAMSRRIAS